MKKATLVLAVIALTAFGLAACGGDDDDDETEAAATTTTETTGGAAGAASTLEVSAPSDGSLAFDQTELSATAGSVTIDFNNPAAISHDVKVEDSSGTELGGTDLVSQGSAEATVDLEAGTYTFFCSVPGHREGGMEGTLIVK
jgi:plastocyanin